MKKTTKILALIIAFIFILSSCSKTPEDTTTTTTEAKQSTDGIFIIKNSISNYKIIRSETGTSAEANAAGELRNAFADYYGTSPAISTDYDDEIDFEILVGKTNRAASGTAAEKIDGIIGFTVLAVGTKIAICVSNDSFLTEAVEYFCDTYFAESKTECVVPFETEYILNRADYNRDGWLLNLPAYEGGILSNEVYYAGAIRSDDSKKNTPDESAMQISSQTKKSEYTAYLKRLEKNGFKRIFENTIEKSDFAQFSKKNDLVYVYYNNTNKETRIIHDINTVSLENFGTANGSGAVELYQYKLDYCNGKDDGSGFPDCGMLYIFKLNDNSLFIVDGGHPQQSYDDKLEELLNFMREITGTPAKDKVIIRSWFISHAHGDHVGLPTAFLSKYFSEVALENISMNIPSLNKFGGYSYVHLEFLTCINGYFQNTPVIKLHTGMTFEIGGLKIEVLATHEDGVNPTTGKSVITDFNDTSTVLMLTFEGKKMLLLGDINTGTEGRLIELYTSETLKCDIVQIAHHGINVLNNIYKRADAEIGLVSNSEYNAYKNGGSCANAHAVYSLLCDTLYYEGNATCKITVIDGKLKVEEK